MKRGILVATLAVTVAGIAGASLLATNSHGVASSAQAAPAPSPVQAQPARISPARAESVPAVPQPAPAPVVQKASLEPRQAPVPLLVRPKPAVNLPAVDAAGAGTASATEQATAPATEAAANDTVAKAAIEADGYKSVRVIRKGENGLWYAKALRGKTEVTLVVDATGSVSAE